MNSLRAGLESYNRIKYTLALSLISLIEGQVSYERQNCVNYEVEMCRTGLRIFYTLRVKHSWHFIDIIAFHIYIYIYCMMPNYSCFQTNSRELSPNSSTMRDWHCENNSAVSVITIFKNKIIKYYIIEWSTN